jgi:hypothetical protein
MVAIGGMGANPPVCWLLTGGFSGGAGAGDGGASGIASQVEQVWAMAWGEVGGPSEGLERIRD